MYRARGKITMKKQSNKVKKYILWAVIVAGIMSVSFGLYHYYPKAYAYRYAFAYYKKDFDKAYSFYNEEAMAGKFTKKQIIKVLEEQSKINSKINPNDLKVIKDKKTKKWFVKFPYSLYSISISTPTGATVYVDDKKVVQGATGKGIEVKDMLPGKHQVKIEYDNTMYPAFITEINVPKEREVASPYETKNILVIAPVGSWVKVGNIIRENLDKQLLFENMLPGQYEISIFMGKDLEVFSQKVQIDMETTTINLEKIKGNERVKEDLEVFFSTFNRAYKVGIMEKDTLFLHKFLTEKVNEDVISDFKMWYIDHKDIKDAKSLMQVRDIYPISGSELRTSVLETAYLVNLEKNGAEEIEQQYRIIIEWDYKLLRHNSSWQIISRDILQSIVAYKNEAGKWIKY